MHKHLQSTDHAAVYLNFYCYIRTDIDTSKMKLLTKLSAIVISLAAAFAAVSCEETPQSTIQPEEILGSFIYEGNTYNIRSVVVYELDNNQTQIWISETAGYTTVDEIEASVGELVITIPDSKIGKGKQSFEQEGNFVKYDDKVNSGFCTLKCDLDSDSKMISFEFSSQKLKAGQNAIEGSYNGPYTEYTLAELENQWAYNRNAKSITAVDYFEMEDGAPSKLIIYDADSRAIELLLAKKHIGVPVTIGGSSTPAQTEVFFDNGEEFKINSSHGRIHIVPSDDNISISIKLTNDGGKTLAANYEGTYRFRYANKANRCVFDSGSEGYGYNGKFELKSMSVSETANEITFRLTPGEHLENGIVNANLAPSFKVSKKLLNEGEIDARNTTEAWELSYDIFQVYSYNAASPDRTRANEGSIFSVEKNENGKYTINIEVSYMISKPVTRDKVDENGNIVYTEVQKTDDFGTPLYDSNGDPIMEQVPVKETVNVDFPTTIDLYYNQAN